MFPSSFSRGQAMRKMRGVIWACVLLILPATVQAIPNLQIYSPEPGVYYDEADETWIIPYYDYDLWVIGGHINVYDVKLGLAVPRDENGRITITNGSDTLILTESLLVEYPGDYEDADPFFVEYGTPLMGDGAKVPGGGVFPTSYYQYYLGDFGLGQVVNNYIPGDDFMDTAPGEIKSIHVSVDGYSWVDIIAYDHVVLGTNKVKYVKTPYSHDGGGGQVPEPGSMFLFGAGMVGAASMWRRRKKARTSPPVI